ncbi:tripartite tricarboxylate transporter permease [Actibacterium lipolyticum]|uniref:Tripartite tricarboxylate transporter TctA family protein n=1 Tax=Actibacterium lipolyticum TaxID=1524263 RepID=A0A238JMU8_9RHOB|nr:tripartite tricarboxylate transporter permease [Actibacterium lipolyticum]SMX31086.1 Tripartite tricarboxylate transporter TctA family protein [Actibacterium lipolyticum]
MDFANHLIVGVFQVLEPYNLAFLIGGFLIGTFFGSVPGLTSVLAVALLLPMTYSIDVVPALIMCASIFMAGMYSGSITAVTINIPGAPSSMMTALDGNKLMRKGHGANALGHAALGSMIGGTIGALLLIALMPMAAELTLLIRTTGKFALVMFALIVIVLVQREDVPKAVLTTVLGMMIATIGIDVMQPVPRFHYGTGTLVEGIDMMPVIIGVFALAELMVQMRTGGDGPSGEEMRRAARSMKRRDLVPKLAEVRQIGLWGYLKASLTGYGIGLLPGVGGSMAAFVAYADAKRSERPDDILGEGSRRGVAVSEAANNGMCGGAFVPMLMFGIPGDPTTAIVLGVLVINGIQPGAKLVETQADMIAPMFISLLFSAMFLIPLTLYLLGPLFIRIVSIPRGILYAGIAVMALMGSYVATISVFQMALAAIFGLFAYFLRRQGYPVVSLLLGFILGPDLELYLRRSLSLSDGDPTIFLTNMDSLFFIILSGIFIYLMGILPWLKKKKSLAQT